eukprot:jgi/Bigna1/75100/fgenesh1_pg.32_\
MLFPGIRRNESQSPVKIFTPDSKSDSMKRSGSFDEKRKVDERIPRRRSSKAQRSEVWGNQIQLTKQEILKLREKENKLNDRLARFEQFYSEEKFTKEELNEKTKKVEAQIAETQKEIQAKEAELKDVSKKFEDATAMEIDESGGIILTENPAGREYAKALVEAEKREVGDVKISKFLPMVLLTVSTVFIPGFTVIAKKEAKRMKDKKIEGILIFGRRCFLQVLKEFRRLRKEYINGAILRICILAGQSGIGKSLAFSQIYMREAFIKGEKVAFYSVQEATIYLFWIEDGKYKCQEAEVNDQGFWKTKAWKTFDDKSAHLIIDPAPRRGHKYFKVHLVEAFVVYLTSPNSEMCNFEQEIRGVTWKRFFVPTFAIEESKVIAIELKENPSVFLERMKRTGGQLREFIREDKYELFKGYQDNAWAGIAAEHIHFGDLKVSSRIFSVQPSTTDETLLYSEKYAIVPQSEWIKSNIFQLYAEKNLENFTGLDGEKWFFAKIYKGCKLPARRLPKHLLVSANNRCAFARCVLLRAHAFQHHCDTTHVHAGMHALARATHHC